MKEGEKQRTMGPQSKAREGCKSESAAAFDLEGFWSINTTTHTQTAGDAIRAATESNLDPLGMDRIKKTRHLAALTEKKPSCRSC